MRDSARYVKIVEWSDEDQRYVGSSSGLIYIELYRSRGRAAHPRDITDPTNHEH